MENLNFLKGLGVFRFILFVLLFFSTNLLSQKAEDTKEVKPATIVLTDGAKLFSSDDNFNKQVLNKKVIIKNSDISLQDEDNQHSLKATAVPAQEGKGTDLKKQVQSAEEKKKKQSLKEVKKQIEKYEKKKAAFIQVNVKGLPSPNQFFSSNNISKNYVGPSQDKQFSSKFCVLANVYAIKLALDFLHSQQYTFCNNKSFDFCFSEVFSVRPPPMFS